jgi:MoaA/NifB/PqqE/SkfB family radical SAM enzyme
MIEYATRHSGVFVTLTTNGTIMNEKRARRLLDSGVHMIDISIDAHTPETYAKVRVNGDLNVTRTNVLNLLTWIRQADLSTKVVVSFIEQPQNSHEVGAFEAFWKEQGVDLVVVRRLHSAAGSVANVARIMTALRLSLGTHRFESERSFGFLPERLVSRFDYCGLPHNHD